MSNGPIVFGNCRYKVADLPGAKEFYSKCFQIEPYFDEPTWVVFEIKDYLLWLEPDNSSVESAYESTNPLYNSAKDIRINYWQVGDVMEVCNLFKELGGSILKAPRKQGPLTEAIVKDPWENILGLHLNLFK